MEDHCDKLITAAARETRETGKAIGCTLLPDGAAFYAWRLRTQTSTSLTAAEVHDLGVKEVARIQSEAAATIAKLVEFGDDRLRVDQGFSENMARLMTPLKQKEDAASSTSNASSSEVGADFIYPDSAEGREQCLSDFRGLLVAIEELVEPLFDLKPRQPCQIEAVPEHMEDGSPGAFYMPPSLCGTRDGVFYANCGACVSE
jgi:uncharacterized protein (DUF885 family)